MWTLDVASTRSRTKSRLIPRMPGALHTVGWEASLVARIHLIMHENPSVDVIKVGPWMTFSWTGLDHGRHHAGE